MPPVCSWMTFAPLVEMVDVGLHDADAQVVLQGVDGRHEGRGLAAAGRGHEVEQEGVIALELFAQQICLTVVVFKNALFDFEHAECIHDLTSRIPSGLLYAKIIAVSPRFCNLFARGLPMLDSSGIMV